MLLNKINNGYSVNGAEYIFQDFEIYETIVQYHILSDSQVLVGTSKGIILLDTSIQIDNQSFESSAEIVQFLFGL